MFVACKRTGFGCDTGSECVCFLPSCHTAPTHGGEKAAGPSGQTLSSDIPPGLTEHRKALTRTQTWRDMSQNLPVAIVRAFVLPLPVSACPGSGQTEPTCQPQLRGCSVPPWSTWEGKLLLCPYLGPAPSAPTKTTPEACKHLFPQLSLHWDHACSKAPREGRGCFHLPVGWEGGDSLGDCPHQPLPYLSSSGLTSGCHHHHSSPPQTHLIWFSGSLCHHSHPPFPALSCLS